MQKKKKLHLSIYFQNVILNTARTTAAVCQLSWEEILSDFLHLRQRTDNLRSPQRLKLRSISSQTDLLNKFGMI